MMAFAAREREIVSLNLSGRIITIILVRIHKLFHVVNATGSALTRLSAVPPEDSAQTAQPVHTARPPKPWGPRLVVGANQA